MNEHASETLDVPSIAPYREDADGISVDLPFLEDMLDGDFPVLELVEWHDAAEIMEAWRDHNVAHLARLLGVAGWPDVPCFIWEQPARHGPTYFTHRFIETLFQFAPELTVSTPALADPQFHARVIADITGDALVQP